MNRSRNMQTVQIGAVGQRFIRVRAPAEPVAFARLWWHGGGQGPGGSLRMAERIPAAPSVLDVFLEGHLHESGPDGPSTGWVAPGGQVPTGEAGDEDVIYSNDVLGWLVANYPTTPYSINGYSSGGRFLQACLHAGVLAATPEHRQNLTGWAVIKNTPTLDFLTRESLGQPVNDRLFEAPWLPPKCLAWYASSDTEAHQTYPYITFNLAIDVFRNTYPDPIVTLVMQRCKGQPVTIERSSTLLTAMEMGGSHDSAWPCIAATIERFFRFGPHPGGAL